MPSIRFWSLGGSGLIRRGAWRSMEASSAPLAKRCSSLGGAVFALVGKKPNMAKASPPKTKKTTVIITPRTNLPTGPPVRLLWQGCALLGQTRNLTAPDGSSCSGEQFDLE